MELEVIPDCVAERDTLQWGKPADCSSDDIMGYRIYWAPFLGDSLSLWREINDPDSTMAVFN